MNTFLKDREDASSVATAGATANTTEGNSRASRESGLLCSHSHGESVDERVKGRPRANLSECYDEFRQFEYRKPWRKAAVGTRAPLPAPSKTRDSD